MSISMKVLHLINTLSAGGAELHLLTLCRYLKAAGVDASVGYFKEVRGSRSLRDEFEGTEVPVVRLSGEKVWNGQWLVGARRWVARERPDILHTHLPRSDFVGWFLRMTRLRVPWVVSAHAIYSRSWRGRWVLPLFSWVWRRADAIIAISHAVKEWLVQEHRIPPEKVFVVHYGIEAERFRGKEGGGRNDGPVIGTIGRLEPVKGHETLIRAMPHILMRFPQARLLIAGHDPWGYGDILRQMVDRLGLSGKVELLGFVTDIPAFLNSIDVFAFASRSEGFGQVIIEAMAAGRPVVASRIPPITEIVVDGETGLLAEPNNPEAFAKAILWVLQNPDKAREMGQRGRKRVEMFFSAEQMAKKTLEVYQAVNGRGF